MEQVIDQANWTIEKVGLWSRGTLLPLGALEESRILVANFEIDKLYRLGQLSEEDPVMRLITGRIRSITKKLAGSLGLDNEAQGIARLVASHTIDFRQSIDEVENNVEADVEDVPVDDS